MIKKLCSVVSVCGLLMVFLSHQKKKEKKKKAAICISYRVEWQASCSDDLQFMFAKLCHISSAILNK